MTEREQHKSYDKRTFWRQLNQPSLIMSHSVFAFQKYDDSSTSVSKDWKIMDRQKDIRTSFTLNCEHPIKKMESYRVSRGFKLMKRDDYFKVDFRPLLNQAVFLEALKIGLSLKST